MSTAVIVGLATATSGAQLHTLLRLEAHTAAPIQHIPSPEKFGCRVHVHSAPRLYLSTHVVSAAQFA